MKKEYYLQCDQCLFEYEFGTPVDICPKCIVPMFWRTREVKKRENQ